MDDGRWDRLVAMIEPRRQAILTHPVYDALTTPDALRIFTQHHVWAVWDFMSLLTRLQADVTCTTVPWTPRMIDPAAQRFVNEIKLGEETDEAPGGGWVSHFELYLAAMDEIGADSTAVRTAVSWFSGTRGLVVPGRQDLRSFGAPAGAAQFAGSTMIVAANGTTVEVAASFALGREQLIPDLFRPLLPMGESVPLFWHYLQRHIEVDEGEHGPLTHQLLQVLAGDDPREWAAAEAAATSALDARGRLWDATLEAITATAGARV